MADATYRGLSKQTISEEIAKAFEPSPSKNPLIVGEKDLSKFASSLIDSMNEAQPSSNAGLPKLDTPK